MGFFDKITKIAEKAADAVVKTSDKINETYQKEGFDGILNKTADSLNQAGKKTQDYFNGIGEKNKQILDSIPEKDLEGTLAKATAVVINTTQTLVKDVAKVTVNTVESVSEKIEKLVTEEETKATTENSVKKTTTDVKELFLNEGQIAELDCMPIKLLVKHLGAESNIDGQVDKYKLDEFTFITNSQKWFDFNNQKGGTGSLSFMNHYIRVKNGLIDNENPEINKEIRNSTFDILTKILEMKEYREDLGLWIKEENSKVKAGPASEDSVVNKPKRMKKTTSPVVQDEKEEVKPTTKRVAKKTTKTLVVEPEVKAPAKKTSKKVVKAAVEETFSTPEVKTRKPKV